jgi:type 1 glutamine amidotransferase
MKIGRQIAGVALALTIGALSTMYLFSHRAANAQPKAKKHVLVVTVTKGFRHGSIPVAEKTIEALGESTGEWDTDFVRTDEEMAAKMTAAGLKKFDAVVFANTTGVLPLPDPQGFLDYIKAGHGFAAMHSGSDTFHEWPGGPKGEVSAYVDMLGGEFLTHHAQCAITPHIADASSPALKGVVKMKTAITKEELDARNVQKEGSVTNGKVWKVFDEIYLLKNNDPANVHTLLWLDAYPNDGSPEANKPGIHLISWTKAYGTGRVFYTELGHRDEVWKDPIYQKHVTGGLEFALGLAKGSTKPGNVSATASTH